MAWCLPYCKGTILKAIHNCINYQIFRAKGVYRIAKVRFWKQFTTERLKPLKEARVFTVLQRYDFESNSQHASHNSFSGTRCLPYCKGTILKAIHNQPLLLSPLRKVFTVLQRYNFGTKSQPFAYIITAIFLFIDYEKDQRHHHPLYRDYAPKSCPSFDVHKNL